jgi:hypothetical protein
MSAFQDHKGAFTPLALDSIGTRRNPAGAGVRDGKLGDGGHARKQATNFQPFEPKKKRKIKIRIKITKRIRMKIRIKMTTKIRRPKSPFSKHLCAIALVVSGFGLGVHYHFLHLTLIGVANPAASG